jgi:hypothetical protein
MRLSRCGLGPDGSYVVQRGSQIVMLHLESEGETVLAASGEIRDV